MLQACANPIVKGSAIVVIICKFMGANTEETCLFWHLLSIRVIRSPIGESDLSLLVPERAILQRLGCFRTKDLNQMVIRSFSALRIANVVWDWKCHF